MITAVAIKLNGVVHSLEPPNRHHNIIRKLAKEGYPTPIKGEQGFIDSEIGFVNRTDALAIAQKNNQVINPNPLNELYSEDLW